MGKSSDERRLGERERRRPDEVFKSPICVGNSPEYSIGEKLGEGGYGWVYVGHPISSTNANSRISGVKNVALKFEHRRSKRYNDELPNEWKVYDIIGDIDGVPRVYFKGRIGEYYAMVMDLLGQSLKVCREDNPATMSNEMVACVALEGISILEKMHSSGYVHGDVKPENFLLGHPDSSEEKKLFLADFGLATRWKDISTDQHVEYEQQPDVFRGTVRYASRHAHLGRSGSRRDDLESLAYTLMFLCLGKLPWQELEEKNGDVYLFKQRMVASQENLCESCPVLVRKFMQYVVNLKFDEEPKYSKCISFFLGMIRWDSTPININRAYKLSLLPHWPTAEELDDKQAEKDVKTGIPVNQWISVYNSRRPMKQCYACNIEDGLLSEKIGKGKEDGLFISCIASCRNLWALIMDSGTGFTAQVHKLFHNFIEKEWIMEHWEENYSISAIAGADNGSFLVVMSKGTEFSQQIYKVSESFPFKWFGRMKNKGFHVTSIATAGTKWAVVMSSNARFADQAIELDFLHPSEGIHWRQERGYRITAIAATPNQIAAVLSIPIWKSIHMKQETHQTSDFPDQHAKEKRARNLYIASICYGQTLS